MLTRNGRNLTGGRTGLSLRQRSAMNWSSVSRFESYSISFGASLLSYIIVGSVSAASHQGDRLFVCMLGGWKSNLHGHGGESGKRFPEAFLLVRILVIYIGRLAVEPDSR